MLFVDRAGESTENSWGYCLFESRSNDDIFTPFIALASVDLINRSYVVQGIHFERIRQSRGLLRRPKSRLIEHIDSIKVFYDLLEADSEARKIITRYANEEHRRRRGYTGLRDLTDVRHLRGGGPVGGG